MKKRKFNKHKFFNRIIASPFIFCLLLIAHNSFVFKRFWHFLKFGGEYVNFEVDERRTLLEIYDMLKEIKEERNKENNHV